MCTGSLVLLESRLGCQMLSGALTDLSHGALHLPLQQPGDNDLEQLTQVTSLTSLLLEGSPKSLLFIDTLALEQLGNLHKLHLSFFSDVPAGMGDMRNLQHLNLYSLHDQTCDLSSCIHVTHLTIGWKHSDDALDTVMLPAGPHVQLRSLEFYNSVLRCPELFETLANLEFATQLTCLDFDRCSFRNNF